MKQGDGYEVKRANRSIWAIIPVKSLYQGKSRLSGVLSGEQRAALIGQFLRRTLETLNQVDGVDHILVVSSDAAVLDIAREYHAAALDEGEPCGLNQAVHRAVQSAAGDADAALILPSDLPFVQLEDIQDLIQLYQAEEAVAPTGRFTGVICADAKRDGTNALLIQLPASFKFQYGVASFQRHQDEAARVGGSLSLIHAPRMEFDLDTEEDWREYQHLANNLISSAVSAAPSPSRDSRQAEFLARTVAGDAGI